MFRTVPSCSICHQLTVSSRKGPKQCLQEGCGLLAVELIALRNGRMVLPGSPGPKSRLLRLAAVGASWETGAQTKPNAHCIPMYGSICPWPLYFFSSHVLSEEERAKKGSFWRLFRQEERRQDLQNKQTNQQLLAPKSHRSNVGA